MNGVQKVIRMIHLFLFQFDYSDIQQRSGLWTSWSWIQRCPSWMSMSVVVLCIFLLPTTTFHAFSLFIVVISHTFPLCRCCHFRCFVVFVSFSFITIFYAFASRSGSVFHCYCVKFRKDRWSVLAFEICFSFIVSHVIASKIYKLFNVPRSPKKTKRNTYTMNEKWTRRSDGMASFVCFCVRFNQLYRPIQSFIIFKKYVFAHYAQSGARWILYGGKSLSSHSENSHRKL